MFLLGGGEILVLCALAFVSLPLCGGVADWDDGRSPGRYTLLRTGVVHWVRVTSGAHCRFFAFFVILKIAKCNFCTTTISFCTTTS